MRLYLFGKVQYLTSSAMLELSSHISAPSHQPNNTQTEADTQKQTQKIGITELDPILLQNVPHFKDYATHVKHRKSILAMP